MMLDPKHEKDDKNHQKPSKLRPGFCFAYAELIRYEFERKIKERKEHFLA